MEQYVKEYLDTVARYYKDENSSEMSYRTGFQILLEHIFPKSEKYHIQHDQRAIEGNKPDFIVSKHGVPLLYIEVKKVGEDLNKIEKSSQASRYFGYTNLVISDYLDFRFYRNGQQYDESIRLGNSNLKTRTIQIRDDQSERLVRTLQDFIQTSKEPIKSGKHLAKIMGGRAQRIRDNVISFLQAEKAANAELFKIMEVIKKHLVADIDVPKFADMYAQTLVYGLFAARYNDTSLETFNRQEARELVPATNPFLRHFFDHIAGANFPKRLEIIVSELCEVFTHADVEKLLSGYYKKDSTKEEKDPVIHFYEDFLTEYNPVKKMEMGVFYTPLPVVHFIIRAVDEILKKEFDIAKGLADDQKIIVEKKEFNHAKGKELKISKKYHKVQVLDVATGTGTFLNEVIIHIFASLKGQEGKWPAYVESGLMPRLHGFELMMASYTIAHLKLGMTLHETGVENITDRIGVYLTNTLDDAIDYSSQGTLFGFMDSIADESKSASRIKHEYPIMVVIGNPPYSGESMNPQYKGNDVYKVEPGGKEKLKEKNSKWINDDYVKFIRFAESLIEKNQEGVVGMITAHGYIDNPTFRGMRWHLRKTFDAIYVLDLHGNSNKKETSPDGSKDENVFDIKTGVSILLCIKKKSASKEKSLAAVYASGLYGTRESKQSALDESNFNTIKWVKLPDNTDVWKVEGEGKAEYEKGFGVNELFNKNSTGTVTARDAMSIQYTKEDIEKVIQDFLVEPAEDLRNKYNLGKDARDWKVALAKADVEKNFDQKRFVEVAYRPFDSRWTFYTGNSKGFHCMPRGEVMKNFVQGKNIGLVIRRQTPDSPTYFFISSQIVADGYIRSDNKGGESVCPLYLYAETGEKAPNLNNDLWERINQITGDTAPEDIFDYIYAYLHSPKYRQQYREFLKTDFPRVPYPKTKDEFWKLVPLGRKLRGLHLLEDPVVNNPTTTYPVVGSDEVEKISYTNGDVRINATQYFGNVPEVAWNFYIGGYQPAQKWLKDRKGRKLTNDDIDHYQKIIAALAETARIMNAIDALLRL